MDAPDINKLLATIRSAEFSETDAALLITAIRQRTRYPKLIQSCNIPNCSICASQAEREKTF